MKKQLFIKAFRAILVLVVFAGAVTMSNAQALPSRQDAALMLNAKLEQIGNTRPAMKFSQGTAMTTAQALATYRYGFYNRIAVSIKKGANVDAAIDTAYSTLVNRNQTAATTLRQEVIDFLTKS
jgi:hypothetical protein